MKRGLKQSLSLHSRLKQVETEIDRCDERFILLGEMVNLANARRKLMQRRSELRKRINNKK